jgi:hypothetical protein
MDEKEDVLAMGVEVGVVEVGYNCMVGILDAGNGHTRKTPRFGHYMIQRHHHNLPHWQASLLQSHARWQQMATQQTSTSTV